MNRLRMNGWTWALTLLLICVSPSAWSRDQIEGVTAIVVTSASGGTNVRADEPEGVKLLMGEINEERGKLWKPFRGKLSSCAARLSFFQNDRRVARLVLDGNDLIELAPASDSAGFARQVASTDLRAVRRLASKVGSCR